MAERQRAAALARHFREAEGLSIEKVRAVKARHLGVCRGCGAYTQSPNRTGDA